MFACMCSSQADTVSLPTQCLAGTKPAMQAQAAALAAPWQRVYLDFNTTRKHLAASLHSGRRALQAYAARVAPGEQDAHAAVMHRGGRHHAQVEQLVRVEGQVEGARPPALWHALRVDCRAHLRRTRLCGDVLRAALQAKPTCIHATTRPSSDTAKHIRGAAA